MDNLIQLICVCLCISVVMCHGIPERPSKRFKRNGIIKGFYDSDIPYFEPPCETVDKEFGSCLNLLDCPPYFALYKKKQRKGLELVKKAMCGFDDYGLIAKVCCPRPGIPKFPPVFVPTTALETVPITTQSTTPPTLPTIAPTTTPLTTPTTASTTAPTVVPTIKPIIEPTTTPISSETIAPNTAPAALPSSMTLKVIPPTNELPTTPTSAPNNASKTAPTTSPTKAPKLNLQLGEETPI